jgi:hypothetical protein
MVATLRREAMESQVTVVEAAPLGFEEVYRVIETNCIKSRRGTSKFTDEARPDERHSKILLR